MRTNSTSPNLATFPPAESDSRLLFGPLDDSMTVDLSSHADPRSGLARIVFFVYKGLHRILGKANLIRSNGQSEDKFSINSRVVSASLSRGRHVQLNTPALIRLKHLRPIMEDSNSRFEDKVVCAFWEMETGSWSDAGCRVRSADAEETLCECNHLTHFAVLVKEDGSHDAGESAIANAPSSSSDERNPSSTSVSSSSTSSSLWAVRIFCYVTAAVIAFLLAILLYKVYFSLNILLSCAFLTTAPFMCTASAILSLSLLGILFTFDRFKLVWDSQGKFGTRSSQREKA